jgi:hypothetical protein
MTWPRAWPYRRRGLRRSAAGAAALGGLLALAGLAAPVSSAAEGPRWAIVATGNPTSPAPGSPQDEAQEVAVNATGGTFTLSASAIRQCAEASNSKTGPIPFNATAGEVQSALEAACSFLEGRIAVTGGSGRYTVTFIEELAHMPVSLLAADGSSLTGPGATVTEIARGRFPPQLVLSAVNVGDTATSESPITIEDALPPGVEVAATAITGYDAYRSSLASNGEGGAPLTCSAPPELKCTYVGKVDPGDILTVTITLAVAPSVAPGSYANTATVTGGGAPEASDDRPVSMGGSAGFGPAPGSVFAATSSPRAGAHANVTTAFTFNTVQRNEASGYPRDIRFDLPPGLVGNVVGLPTCPIARLVEGTKNPNACPPDSMVGMAVFTGTEGALREFNQMFVAPVYNVAPASGEPAAFAFNAIFFPVRLDTSVLSNGSYGVRVTVAGVPQQAQTLSTFVTIWGVPADHNGPGEDKSLYNLVGGGSFGGPNPAQTRRPLLTNPQQCTEAASASMSADSWANPGVFVSSGPVPMGTFTGCEGLSMQPAFTMLPEKLEAGVPSGYVFDLHVPQREEPDSLANPTIKNVKLTLPAGVVVSPSAASGLTTCSASQFFGPGRGQQEPASPGHCPGSSLVGTAEVGSPVLAQPLQGQLYAGEPDCDPCTSADAQEGRLIRLFLQVIEEGESPLVVKLEGRSKINQQTGQIVTTFTNDPQLPFSELKVVLSGGPRATLANPRTCGFAASSLDLTPWSSPFTPNSLQTSGFEVNQSCFGSQFAPSFTAGMTNVQAGAYGPFVLSFGRGDHDEFLTGLELRMPPGLLGKLATITPCGEPQANEGTCDPSSLIGDAQVLVGPGPQPLRITGGHVFLTRSYKGAPFGLSVVMPAIAGPYTLAGTTGKGTVVVRASLNVDPTDAHITVKSDPLPTMLDGVPLQLRAVETTVDRPGFTFNPTNCSQLSINATITGEQGATAGVSVPFEVANCANLPFKPKFTVLTQAKTSKANGASLHVKVTSGPGQANIGKVRVDLPKQLPSRLTTLQQACPDATFTANPASCPAGSLVGTATAVTPVLTNPLTGPAYLVSHAGAAFPDLVIVLQGEGITLDLVGNTDIKKGITISTFNSVPDAPISTFDLVLPEGPHSALAAYGNLCKTALNMPTVLTGQNGAVIKQTTKIAVSGCPKHKAKKRKKTARKHKKGSGKRK